MKKIKWFKNLTGGLNQAVDSPLVANNQLLFTKNMSLQKLGNLVTRGGTSLFNTRINTTDSIWGLFEYEKYSTSTGAATKTLGCLTDRDLYFSNTGETAWEAAFSSDVIPATTRIRTINHGNRLYIAVDDSTTGLKYTEGSSLSSATPTTPGGIVASNKHILAVGGGKYLKNNIFFTDPYVDDLHIKSFTATVAGGTPTIISAPSGTFAADMLGLVLFNPTDGDMATIVEWGSSTGVEVEKSVSGWNADTIYIMKNNYRIDGPLTGMIGFRDFFISFDEDTMYVWDPLSKYEQKIDGFGCSSPDTVKICGGQLVWVNRSGIYRWSGSLEERPEDISILMKDREKYNGVWDLLTTSNFSTMSAGVDNQTNTYYLSIGTLQTKTGALFTALANVVLAYNLPLEEIEIHSYAKRPWVFCNHKDKDGKEKLYFGAYGEGAVYEMGSQLTDSDGAGGTTAIAFDFATQQYNLGDPQYPIDISKVFVRYVATANVTLQVSVDDGAYSTIATLPASSTITALEIEPIRSLEGVLHSLRFTGTGHFVLKGFGFEYEQLLTTRKPNY